MRVFVVMAVLTILISILAVVTTATSIFGTGIVCVNVVFRIMNVVFVRTSAGRGWIFVVIRAGGARMSGTFASAFAGVGTAGSGWGQG